MAQTSRLKTILEMQDAADRAHVAELARQATTEFLAKASWARVRSDWLHLCRTLRQTMDTANGAMTGGRKLYWQHYNPEAGNTVGDVIIMFEDKYSEEVERKCIVDVDPKGKVSVCMMPQRQKYNLDIWTATPEQIEAIVYDFMELNI